MRLIDVDELFNKAVNLEAVAFEQVKKYEPLDNPSEWHIWSAILTERTAFKYDLMDAPTIEAEPIRHGHWEWNDYGGFGNYHCTVCRYIPYGKFSRKFHPDYMYCPRCGAKMDEEVNENETY